MRKLLIASVSLLLLTNVVVLAGVAYNRSGEPLTTIELTERELPVRQSFNRGKENSGTSLEIEWQLLDPSEDLDSLFSTYVTPAWLDDSKLIELGFDVKAFENDLERYQYKTSNLAVNAVFVLEYKGEAYQKELSLAESKAEKLREKLEADLDNKKLKKKFENIEAQLKRLIVSQSRLYVVDAGLDEEVLMKRYTGNNYLFLRGEIGLSWNKKEVEGRIKHLYITDVHVPLPLSSQIAELTKGEKYPVYGENRIPPRYKVKLDLGKRLEPWVESVSSMENTVN